MPSERFDITGRTAFITGSSRGIGRALAIGLLEAGATVVLNGRDTGQLDRTRMELSELHDHASGAVHAVAFDVTDSAAVAKGISCVERLVGPIDILVNNAGVQHRAPLTEFTRR